MSTMFVKRTLRTMPRVMSMARTRGTKTAMFSTAYDREVEFSPAPASLLPWRSCINTSTGSSSVGVAFDQGADVKEDGSLLSIPFEEQVELREADGPARNEMTDPRPLYESSTRGLECGDLRLGQFMEEVKNELWQYNAIPFRKRFRVQSLLRRLQTPPFETWMDSLVRATDSCPRPFTRTLLARYEGPPSLPPTIAPGFDLLLLCWRPGATSAIHDHPDNGCWVKVLKGQIHESRYRVPGGDRTSDGEVDVGVGGDEGLIETSAATYGAGMVTYMEDSMGYHKMENASTTEECLSLHLYSPGIVACNTWSDGPSFRKHDLEPMSLDDSFVSA